MKKAKKTDPYFHGVATVGERGQIVIPAEARKLLNLKKGEKLIVFSGEKGMIALAKVSELREKINKLSKLIKPF